MSPENAPLPKDHREKSEFLLQFYQQLETQVQFGDTKASLLVAGDTLLLGISGALVNVVSGCPEGKFSADCMKASAALVLAFAAAGFLVVSLGFALWAARPSPIHKHPPADFFLLSYVARLPQTQFIEQYKAMSYEDLEKEALIAMHSKAAFATLKFLHLRRAVNMTLISVASLVAAVLAAGLQRLLR